MPTPAVLVVDDDPAIRRLLELHFEQDGFAPSSVSDGHEALRVISERRPDAVVLDVMMPDLDGFEVCRRVRAEPWGAQPVVLMLTGRAGTELMTAGLAAGADDYVVKPPDLADLSQRIRHHLRRRAAADALPGLNALGSGHDFQAELSRRLAVGEPAAVAFLDFDHFRFFNQRYGYERGEQFLDWLAGRLAEAARACPSAVIGRVGSDDFFAVVHPDEVDQLTAGFQRSFESGVTGFYDDDDAARGYVEVEDANGQPEHHPILHFSLGVTTTRQHPAVDAVALMQLAVEMSRHAKLIDRNCTVADDS